MSGSARTSGTLKVRERHGVRSFWLTWYSGGRRHTVLLGCEREGLTERSARTAAGLILALPTPPNPELVGAVVGWARAAGRRPADG
jgi:hypothetical protein